MRVYKHINGVNYHRKIILVVDTRKHPSHLRIRSDIICIEIYDGWICYIDCLRKMDIMNQTGGTTIELPPYDMYHSHGIVNGVYCHQSCLPYYVIMDKYIENENYSEDAVLYTNRFGGYTTSDSVPIGYIIYRANISFNYIGN